MRILLPLKLIVFLLYSTFINAQKTNTDQIEWSDSQLKFEHFKAKAKSSDGIKGEMSSKISWITKQYPGEAPEYIIYNLMIPSLSWVSMQHEELLREYQFIFNISEIYARKIRKDVLELNKKKVIDKETYKATILKHINTLHKEKRKFDGVLYNQPDFYKILNKQYQDSLKMYQQYSLK